MHHSARTWRAFCFAYAFVVASACGGASAPSTTAAPTATGGANTGAPAASAATAQRVAIPRADPPFTGHIGETYRDSTPAFPPRVRAPEGAPNVLLVLLDDVGFGATSTFGGTIPTPHLDQLATQGLRYTQFHTTALCSPTRAALLTGRNHHSVGAGTVQETSTGYPGYTGIIPRSAGTIGQVLGGNGYATAWFGKNHNVPVQDTTSAGPFDNWPTSRGFDYFYGFIGGETDQWVPFLYENTSPIPVPKTPEQGYHLTTDLADHTIDWIRSNETLDPSRPWLAYLAPGATHAPHHAPREWIERFRGQFDHGWDRQRELILENQKRLGIVPANTELTPRPEQIPAWDSLNAEQKRLYAHMMEVYAGFLAHTDAEIGRVLDELDRLHLRDETLIVYVVGDNGASAEGSLQGAYNELAMLGGLGEDFSFVAAHADELGTPLASNHYPVGWAWAMDSPFQWAKQVASHFGGTRNGLVVSWPSHIRDVGTVRPQFHHVIDIAPTLYSVAGISRPDVVNGIEQKPIEGTSMVYTFEDATTPSRRRTQYFEMLGNRALYHDGWVAAARHGIPWLAGQSTGNFEGDRWELYNVAEDFSEAHDLAAQNPEKLRELQAMFREEATRYQVYPLDDRLMARFDVTLRPNPFAGRAHFSVGPEMVDLPEGAAPNLAAQSFTAIANIELPARSFDGVLFAMGGRTGGLSLYVKNKKLCFAYNYAAQETYTGCSSRSVPSGRHALGVRVDYRAGENGRPGTGTATLVVDGDDVGRVEIGRRMPFRFSTETFDVGRDSLTAVTLDYANRSPFATPGRIVAVDFEMR